MAPSIQGGQQVYIQLERDDLNTIDDGGENVEIECPHTGETIYLGRVAPQCECCGRQIDSDDYISPHIDTSRLRSGGTCVYTSAHSEDDITIVLRAEHGMVSGWE